MTHVSRFLDPNLLQQLNQLQVSARQVVEGVAAGLHRSRVHGASVDFRQHRPYVPGDEPRRLDWRLLARSDRPFVREYHEETNLRAVIMLDCSGSMRYGQRFGNKFEYGARLTAALSYLMISQTESVGLALFAEKISRWVAPHAEKAQLAQIIEMLERADPAGQSAPDAAMHEAADRLGRRSLVIVVSDLFIPVDRLRRALARLRHARHEVILMQILDPDELNFPFRGQRRFYGLEGEASSLCDATLLRKTYQTNFETHRRDLEGACRLLGAEWTRMVTDRPLDETLLSFLRHRAITT